MTHHAHTASIIEYLHSLYLPEFEAVLSRRAAQFEHLAEKDLFEMPDEAQGKHQALVTKLANELITLDKMRWIAEEYRTFYTEVLESFLRNVAQINEQYDRVAKEALFWKSQYLKMVEEESTLMDTMIKFLKPE